MDVARLAAFQNDRNSGAFFGADQMLLDRRDCQKRGDSDMVFVDAPVGEDNDIVALFVGAVAFDK